MRALLALLLVAAGLAACSRPEPYAAIGADAEHEAGRRIYNFRCYFCHGYSGDARTLAASMVEPAPRDFTRARGLDERSVAAVLRAGVAGTAMTSFAGTLSPREIELVARFVVNEFVVAGAPNTRYHTRENGWADHGRYAEAFPFANGEIEIDRPEALLSERERAGKRLFMSTCISCHDRAKIMAAGAPWQSATPGRER